MFGSRSSTILFVLAALGLAGPAAAQAPSVGFVFPPGGQTGTRTTVNVNGGNLQGATALLISGEGVQAQLGATTNAASLPVELTIAPNAQPGPREIRIVTPRGTSNAGRVWVGAYPEAGEKEPNNTVAAPQKVEKLPVTIHGQVNGAEDVDSYTFEAGAGDTYVFDLVAYRMASALDGYLMLTDARGKVLQSALEGFDRDPRIVYTFKNAGTYMIQVRDTLYRGGGNFTYKLTLGKLPVVTGYLPLGGRRGQTVSLQLEGVNLGDVKTVSVKMPDAQEQMTVVPATPMGPAVNPISLQVSDLNEVVEAEPNDAPAQATPVPAAATVINGRMDKAGDVDLFRFKAAAAGNLVFEVQGRRIGSRIDSDLRILDAMGKVLTTNDDAAGKDSRVAMGVQANTEYLVEVRSTDRRFGGDVFYRLRIEPPGGPDFSLTMTPDSLNVGQGGSTLVTVTAARANGFAGPIDLKVEGLPAGVTVSPARIPAGGASAQFTLTAEAGAATGVPGRIRVIGTGTVGDKPVERVAQPVETYLPPLAPQDRSVQRPTEISTATVMPPTAYALQIEPRVLSVKKGTQNVEIKITAIRQMGQNGQINITVAGQPANVAPVLANIEANKTEAVLKLNVAANAPEVTQNLIITGNMSNNIQVAPALTLTITP